MESGKFEQEVYPSSLSHLNSSFLSKRPVVPVLLANLLKQVF